MALTVIDTLSFYGNNPSVVQVAPGIYAIAFHRGLTPDGWLHTVSIDGAGNIGPIDTWEFETTQGRAPSIIHVSGDIYAIAYEDIAGNGQLITVEIDSAGNITVPRLDIFEFYTYVVGIRDYLAPHIIHVSGDIFAIVYADANQDGWLATVDIDIAGNIAGVDTYRYDAAYARYPHIEHIFGTVYAIAYMGTGSAGYLKTLTIPNNGIIPPLPEIATLVFDVLNGDTPTMVHVAGDIYAIAYTGQNNDGWLATVDIDNVGNIAAVDNFEFDEVNGREPHIIKLSSGLYAIAYRGVANDGFVITITIESSGAIGAIGQTLEYDTSSGYWPYIFEITPGIVAIAYGIDGRVKTIGEVAVPTVSTNPATLVVFDSGTPNGTLDADGGVACDCGFEWGETIAYGNTTPTQSRTTGLTFAQTITGLDPNKTYHFRAFATNPAGTSYGADRTFTTLVAFPTVTTNPATDILQKQAAINGTLDDDGGEACDCGFEWGETDAYGNTTPTQSKNTGETFSQALSGLSPNVTYHFRAFATNAAGTSYGADRTFTSLELLRVNRSFALARHEL